MYYYYGLEIGHGSFAAESPVVISLSATRIVREKEKEVARELSVAMELSAVLPKDPDWPEQCVLPAHKIQMTILQ